MSRWFQTLYTIGILAALCGLGALFGTALKHEGVRRCYEVDVIQSSKTVRYEECCSSKPTRWREGIEVCGTLYPADRIIIRRIPE